MQEDTIPNSMGCDSIIHLNLEILPIYQNVLTITACDQYISPGGKLWNQTGIYTDTLNTYRGCDSIFTVNLTIPVVNVTVHQTEDTLIADIPDAIFQWLQCYNNFQPVEGATFQRFTPETSGEYAVEITQSNCVDTSECYTVILTGILDNTLGEGLKVYPNPANSYLTVSLPARYDHVELEIQNLSGQIILKNTYGKTQKFDVPLGLSPGMYLLTIRNNHNQWARLKILVE
jgi:hypothetical protein